MPAGGTAQCRRHHHPAAGPANDSIGGYIVFTPQGGGPVYRVPFAGFVGDYQAIQVLGANGEQLPVAGRSSSGFQLQ